MNLTLCQAEESDVSRDDRSNVDVGTLADQVAHFFASEGIHSAAIPRLHVIRSNQPTSEIHAVQEPAICIVLGGAKRVVLGERVFEYEAGGHLVASFDLPIIGQITKAAPASPYLCLRLDLDPTLLSDLVSTSHRDAQSQVARLPGGPGLELGRTTAEMLDAAGRLFRLVETPGDIVSLAPLYERELLYRLLATPEGHSAATRVLAPGRGPQVARAIAWIKAHYREPFDMAELTRAACLQPSALHHHFRAATLMSPLQYHKRLRLLEARRAMLFEASTAASAAFSVGYASPSQFSREYRRQFGRPPMQDVHDLALGSLLLDRA